MKTGATTIYAMIAVSYKNHPDFDRLVRAIHNSGRLIISNGIPADHIEGLKIPVTRDSDFPTPDGTARIDILVCPSPLNKLREGLSHREIIEEIDTDLLAMIITSAKNYEHTSIICDPEDYGPFTAMIESGDEIPLSQRENWAAKAVKITSEYLMEISGHLLQARPSS